MVDLHGDPREGTMMKIEMTAVEDSDVTIEETIAEMTEGTIAETTGGTIKEMTVKMTGGIWDLGELPEATMMALPVGLPCLEILPAETPDLDGELHLAKIFVEMTVETRRKIEMIVAGKDERLQELRNVSHKFFS